MHKMFIYYRSRFDCFIYSFTQNLSKENAFGVKHLLRTLSSIMHAIAIGRRNALELDCGDVHLQEDEWLTGSIVMLISVLSLMI